LRPRAGKEHAPAPAPLALATPHARILASTLGRPLIGGNRVDVLADAAAIADARDHVNVESYILAEDGPGESLAGLLMQQRARGVCVNVIFDNSTSAACSTWTRRVEEWAARRVEFFP
jgi:cardiolipin synthase